MALTERKVHLLRLLSPWVWPARIAVRSAGAREVVDADVARWVECIDRDILRDLPRHRQFDYLMTGLPEFRCVLRYRVAAASVPWRMAVRLLYRFDESMVLDAGEIGPGLFLQHGHGTKISAERIGSNCFVNQWVTVGYTDHGRPTIGDGVRIGPGAVVVGPVTLGDGCRIGPNAVIVKDVAAGSTMTAPAPVERRPRTTQ